MSDVRVSDLAKQATLKPNATTLLIQDDKTWQMSVTTLSASIYNAVMKSALSDTPIGQVSFFAMKDVVANPTPPSGWFICDGREINISDFPELFAVISTDFGTPSSKTKFKIPDLKNTFIKGWDGLDTSGTTTDTFINSSAGSTIAAWVTFDGSVDKIEKFAGSNIDSVEKIYPGVYKIFFKTQLRNISYCIVGTSGDNDTRKVKGYNICIPGPEYLKKGDTSLKTTAYCYVQTFENTYDADSANVNVLIVDDDEPSSFLSTQKTVTFVPCIKYRNVVSSSTSVLPSLTIWDEGTKKGLITDLKVVGGNVKVDISGTIATLTVDTPTTTITTKTSGKFSNVIKFETEVKGSQYTRMAITDEPAIITWGAYGTDARKRFDSSRENIWPPVAARFEGNYLIKNNTLTISKLIHGLHHDVCLLSDNTLWFNGWNTSTRTGLNPDGSTYRFKNISNLIAEKPKIKDFEIIVTDSKEPFSIFAITTDGKLYGWGISKNGSLGFDNTNKDVTTPKLIDVDGKKVSKVVASRFFNENNSKVLVLCEDGSLYGSGINTHGALGVGDNTVKSKFTRCKLNTGAFVADASKIITGYALLYNSFFISKTNKVYACGRADGSFETSLGDGKTTKDRTFSYSYKEVPFPLDAGEYIVDIVASGGASEGLSCLALSSKGKLYSWGSKGGIIGHGTTDKISSPKLVELMKSVVVKKIFASNSQEGNNISFGCIDNAGFAYITGFRCPSEETNYTLNDSTYTTKFSQVALKDVVDIMFYPGLDALNSAAISFLDKNGRYFSIGYGSGNSNGETNRDYASVTELNLTS